MITTKELREITQKEKVVGRERPWFYVSLQRGPSIYLTRLFLATSITPNQITILSIFFGLWGVFLIFSSGFGNTIAGLICLYLNILLDKVDGEVARFKKIFSLKGVYLDEINHLTIPGLFFAALTLALFENVETGRTMFLFWGISAALSMPFIRIGHSLAPQIFVKKFLKKRELFTLPRAHGETAIDTMKKRGGVKKRFLSVAHQFQEFFMILLTFFIAVILEESAVSAPITLWLVRIYGVLLPLIFIENTLKGALQIEQRISDLSERFKISE